MSDLTKCGNHDCPRKYDCLRYTARPDLYQSWARFIGGTDCEGFIDDTRLDEPAQCEDGACHL